MRNSRLNRLNNLTKDISMVVEGELELIWHLVNVNKYIKRLCSVNISFSSPQFGSGIGFDE